MSKLGVFQSKIPVTEVTSVNELRNIEAISNEQTFLSLDNATFYRYDPSDTTSPDNGDSVIVNNTTGQRYKDVRVGKGEDVVFTSIQDGINNTKDGGYFFVYDTFTQTLIMYQRNGSNASEVINVSGGSNVVAYVDDINGLQSLVNMEDGQATQITTTGRSGLFRWNSSDLKAECDADPQMGIYVPPTGQDGSAGAWVRQFGQAVMMIPTVEARWFGLRANGVDDDAPAIKAARDFLAPITTGKLAGGFVDLPAGEILIGSTIAHLRQGVVYRGRGISEPGLGGTVIRCADSMAGLDVFVFKDSSRGGLIDLVLLGNETFKPNRAVFFDNELATTELDGNAKNRLENVTIGRVTFGSGSPPPVSFLRGVEWGGENGNNDEFVLSNVSIAGCDEYGIHIPFIQSIWGSFENVFVGNCGTGIRSRSNFTAYNLTFNRNNIDMDFLGGEYAIFGYNSEHTGLALKFSGAGGKAGVNIYGGELLCSEEMDAGQTWADVSLGPENYLNIFGLGVSKSPSATADSVIKVNRLSGAGAAATVRLHGQFYNGHTDAGYEFSNLNANWETDQALWVEVTNGAYTRRQLITGSAAPSAYDVGNIRMALDTAGFFGSAPIARPDVSGATDGNTALQSLVAALTSLGLITDSTT